MELFQTVQKHQENEYLSFFSNKMKFFILKTGREAGLKNDCDCLAVGNGALGEVCARRELGTPGFFKLFIGVCKNFARQELMGHKGIYFQTDSTDFDAEIANGDVEGLQNCDPAELLEILETVSERVAKEGGLMNILDGQKRVESIKEMAARTGLTERRCQQIQKKQRCEKEEMMQLGFTFA